MITPQGFQLKRMPTIIEEMENSFRSAFGESIDLSANGPLGQIIGIHAEREALLWEMAQDVYNSQYPNTSIGRSLDNSVSLTGTRRKPSTYSTIARGVARGIEGTIVPIGTIISVMGNDNARFVTQEEVTISIADGDAFKSPPISLIAESTGRVIAQMGTLTNIITPVAGLASFTNETDAVVGTGEESDSELKTRRIQELNLAGVATVEAIKSRLSARERVEAVEVFQNNAAIPINGRPPSSVEILVKGDTVQDLASAIFELVGGGITYFGNITEVITDSQGFQQTIKFSRPTDVPVFVNFTIETNENYPLDGDDRIKSAIVAWGENLSIGQNVVLFGSESLGCTVDGVPGITGLMISVGKMADNLQMQNLDISPSELAIFSEANITITKND